MVTVWKRPGPLDLVGFNIFWHLIRNLSVEIYHPFSRSTIIISLFFFHPRVPAPFQIFLLVASQHLLATKKDIKSF